MKRGSIRIMYLTIFLDLLGFGLVLPYIPAAARAMGANDALAPALGAAFFLAQFVAIPFWGRLSDRIGRRPVFLMSYAASAVSMTIFALTPNLAVAFAARLLGGLAISHILMAQATIADLVASERRTQSMGVLGVAFGVGFLVGPPLGGVLGELHLLAHPCSVTGLIWAGLSLINFFIALFALKESLPEGPSASHAGASHFGDIAKAIKIPGVGIGLVVAASFFFWFEAVQQTLVNFTADRFKMGFKDFGALLGFVGIIGTIIQAGLIGRLSRRFGEGRLIVAGCAFQAVGLALTAISPSERFLYGAAFFGAIGTGLIVPCSSSYITRCADARSQGVALGALQAVCALCRIAGPLVAGQIYQGVGPTGPFYAGALFLVVTAFVAKRLRQSHAPAPVRDLEASPAL